MNINEVTEFLKCPLRSKHVSSQVEISPSLTTIYPTSCWKALDYYFKYLAEGKTIPESRLLSVFMNALNIIKVPAEFQERYKRNFIFFSKLYLKRVTKFADRVYYRYPVSSLADINTVIEGSVDAILIKNDVDIYYELHFYRNISEYKYYHSLFDLRFALAKMSLLEDPLFGDQFSSNTNIVIVDIAQEKILRIPLQSIQTKRFKSEAGAIAASIELKMFYSRNDGDVCAKCMYKKICLSYLNADAKPSRPVEYE